MSKYGKVVEGTEVHVGYDHEYGWWVFAPEAGPENIYPRGADIERVLTEILGITAVSAIKRRGGEAG
jgi:hypothetical protein